MEKRFNPFTFGAYKTSKSMKNKDTLITGGGILLSFIAAWIVTACVVSPFLINHLQQTAFLTGCDFFLPFCRYPGGICDYAARLIAACFAYNVPGSFLIVLGTFVQGWMLSDIVQRMVGNSPWKYTLFTLPMVLGTVMLCNYHYPYYVSMRLLVGFFVTWVFCRMYLKHPGIGVAGWPLLAAALHFLAGSAALLVFSLSSILILLIDKKLKHRLVYAALGVVLALAMPYVVYKWLVPTSLEGLYAVVSVKPLAMLAYQPDMLLYAYYALLPAVLTIIWMHKGLYKKNPKQVQQTQNKKHTQKTTGISSKRTWGLVIGQVVLCGALGFLLFHKTYNPMKKNMAYIDYYADRQDWKNVLEVSHELPYDFRVNVQVDRALYHLGMFSEKIFEYPHNLGVFGLFPDAVSSGAIALSASDLYYDLGMMSESLHWAFEAQTLLPDSPRALKRLVMIYLILEDYPLAAQFMRVLQKNMFCRTWVKKYARYVINPLLTGADGEIVEKRMFNPTETLIDARSQNSLKLLVETCPYNRMAYEYLLAYDMLELDFSAFIDHLQHFTRYDFQRLPSSWQEALTMCIAKTEQYPPYFMPGMISNDCLSRFNGFNYAIRQCNGNLQAAKAMVWQPYANTFWYYLVYLSPNVMNIHNNKIIPAL